MTAAFNPNAAVISRVEKKHEIIVTTDSIRYAYCTFQQCKILYHNDTPWYNFSECIFDDCEFVKQKTECEDYKPDIQAQGDCINCGHPWENHQMPKTHTVEIENEYLCGKLIDGDVQRFVCVGIKPVRGDTVAFTNQGHKLATVVVSGVDTVELRPTDMSLNGCQLFSIIHDRDADLTDNEFAIECGFEGYMELADWVFEISAADCRFNSAVRAVCVRWSV